MNLKAIMFKKYQDLILSANCQSKLILALRQRITLADTETF